MNVFTWLLSHGQDLRDLLAIEEKCRADFPATANFGSLLTWYAAHKADFAAGEALIAKIAADFPHSAPQPGPLKADEMAKALTAEAVAIGQPGHPWLQWIVQNLPTILADLPAIIGLFGGGKKTP